MEQFQESREKAKKNIQIADHMLGVTYPLVKDTKLLVAIMENIFLAHTNAMAAILYHERVFKRIPPFQDTFDSKFNMFRERCVEKYEFDKSEVADMRDIKELLVQHRKSPMEFVRKDRFVICSDNYRMKTLSLVDIQSYISKAKIFIEKMNSITSENEGLFR